MGVNQTAETNTPFSINKGNFKHTGNTIALAQYNTAKNNCIVAPGRPSPPAQVLPGLTAEWSQLQRVAPIRQA